ncbi:MAG TPA: hypothetical protein PKA41_08675 [Verrucomicrobiota bacterium]|nr:hypothetical protein [Verrucomicrobiota bacterium]
MSLLPIPAADFLRTVEAVSDGSLDSIDAGSREMISHMLRRAAMRCALPPSADYRTHDQLTEHLKRELRDIEQAKARIAFNVAFPAREDSHSAQPPQPAVAGEMAER